VGGQPFTAAFDGCTPLGSNGSRLHLIRHVPPCVPEACCNFIVINPHFTIGLLEEASMTSRVQIRGEVIDIARQIAADVAGPNAAAVDRNASFPEKAIEALRMNGLLAASIPREFGGLGCSTSEVAEMCSALANGCASTAAIFAMHQVQALCLSRHASKELYFSNFLTNAASRQWLIASATSEAGTEGNLRSSQDAH
jgi:alkylation response protein AidB-like acyl-CoA dehydrogenase